MTMMMLFYTPMFKQEIGAFQTIQHNASKNYFTILFLEGLDDIFYPIFSEGLDDHDHWDDVWHSRHCDGPHIHSCGGWPYHRHHQFHNINN